MQPMTADWGLPDPASTEGTDARKTRAFMDSAGSAPSGRTHPFALRALMKAGKRRAFELTRQAIGYRMLQLLELPRDGMARASLQAARVTVGRS